MGLSVSGRRFLGVQELIVLYELEVSCVIVGFRMVYVVGFGM